ncbi:MAG TPA: beta-ketoacyl synthase N-terminal-like domain-containing protein, partial [Syntrophales bacterium]|nr:beta-ketoacyl synthase N-terminal-like domain-containing protein [Syntrophales bacterium]
MRRRVVVTGMGVIAPNAYGVEEFEKALREGRSGIRFIQEMKDLNFSCQVGGIPQGVDKVLMEYFDEEERNSINDNIGYAAIASMDAWKDAGFTVPKHDSGQVDWATGAIIGSGIGGMDTIG